MNNHSFGCDFGSYHLKIYNRDADGYLMQHNMVAVQDKNKLLACGDEAYAMYEKAPANIHVGAPMSYGNLASISNMQAFLKKLLEEIFLRHPVISKEFKYHSAAKAMHHSFRGGLVEHTLSVTQLCDFLAPRYNYVNRDILVASAMLHDVGKVLELSDFPTNDYTDDGQLLGHLILGSELIRDAAAKIDGFPKRLESLMKHCMLSHHGEYEYGSPKLPSTPEAFLLHCADNLDAKTKMIEEALAADSTQGHWAGYNRMLQRNLSRSDFE